MISCSRNSRIGNEKHGMLGAQRRVEARIGQLLGEGPGRGRSEMNHHADSFHAQIREEFRVLARGFDVLTPDEWRKARKHVEWWDETVGVNHGAGRGKKNADHGSFSVEQAEQHTGQK